MCYAGYPSIEGYFFARSGPSPFSISIRKQIYLLLKYAAAFGSVYTSESIVLHGPHQLAYASKNMALFSRLASSKPPSTPLKKTRILVFLSGLFRKAE